MSKRDATLQALRLKYNAALAAHQGCMRTLTEASMSGARPSAELLEREAKARQELTLVREQLLAAMTESITGGTTPTPPPLSAELPGGTDPPEGTP